MNIPPFIHFTDDKPLSFVSNFLILKNSAPLNIHIMTPKCPRAGVWREIAGSQVRAASASLDDARGF